MVPAKQSHPKRLRMKAIFIAAIVLLAGLVRADNCTPNLIYCGHSLIAKGNYRGQLNQLYEDKLGITVSQTDGDMWNGDLFSCIGGRSGVVARIQACPNGVCHDNGNGKNDSC